MDYAYREEFSFCGVAVFFLRRGVRFHDGTPLNAAAVCFNFERWYGFTGSLQGADYFWSLVFGGFRKHEPGSPGPGQRLYLTLTTGPSRTADIERVLTIGVQGPRAVHLVVVGGGLG